MTDKPVSPIAWSQLLTDAVNKPGTISTAYSVFHGYSLGNMLLALGQCAARGIVPGPLATFKKWQSLGRCVKKGEKAIVLCMPITMQKRDAKPNENGKIVFFTFKPRWFALSQTDGAEYTANMPKMDWDCLAAEIKLDISETEFAMLNGNAMGYAEKRKYAINPLNKFPHKTRFHEMAHIVLGHTDQEACMDGEDLTRSTKEVEAESVAMILCETLGLPGVEYSRGYIQHWIKAGTANAIDEKTAQRIFACAEKILRAGIPKPEKEVSEVEAETAQA